MCGISDTAVQKKLLQEASLTLEKCLNIYRAAEAANSQLKQILHQSPEAVHQLKHRGRLRQRASRDNSKTVSIVAGNMRETSRNVQLTVRHVTTVQ